MGLIVVQKLILFLIVLRTLRWNIQPRHLLPPGPSGCPYMFVNRFQLPVEYPWKVFAEWGRVDGGFGFGDIFHTGTSDLLHPTIVLNSARAASALLIGKDELYSGRPVITMYSTRVGLDSISMLLLQPGAELRMRRRLLHGMLGTWESLDEAFRSIQEREMPKLLGKVADDPEQFVNHMNLIVSTTILLMSYGYRVKETDDPVVALRGRAGQDLREAAEGLLFDAFPILCHVPRFKQKAKEYKKNIDTMIEIPYRFVKEQMAGGAAMRSFTSCLLERGDVSPEEEHAIKCTASDFREGTSKITSVIHAFLLVMTLHPSIQKRAQEEVDALMGGLGMRLPTLADRTHLPYVAAILSEVLRWSAIIPLGFPRRVCRDDFYNTYFIQKDDTVIPNIWQMLHDPEIYADPMTFNPDRFLHTSNDTDVNTETQRPERNPRDFCFGFGSRICPGMILGESSVFLACAMMLAVFDIKKATMKTEDGHTVEVEPVVDFTSQPFLSQPKPFEYSITPRSQSAEALIRGVGAEDSVSG